MRKLKVFILDSSTQSQRVLHRGHIVVTGSHGGINASQYAIDARVGALISNDAGFGRDEAGVAGLPALQAAGIAAATVSNTSARIGEGQSTWDDGIISAANALALAAGVELGQTAQQACAALGAVQVGGTANS